MVNSENLVEHGLRVGAQVIYKLTALVVLKAIYRVIELLLIGSKSKENKLKLVQMVKKVDKI